MPSFAQRDKRDFTPETACPCPQIYFDPILGNHARTLPSVTLAYNTRLDSFRQDDDGVTAQVTDMATGAARTLRAQYLVGCDGPSGIVRDALGIGIEGIGAIAHSVNLFFRSPELATSHDKGWARFYRVIDETGCWGELIPIDGKELWRLTVFDEPLSRADPDFLLRKMAGGAFPYEMISVSPWERRDYVARSYGQGRILIAGDAAHECSPTGGIGMHTGLEEAVNLGWKLAAMAEGWGGPALLASYEIERRPIARAQCRAGDAAPTTPSPPSPAGARASTDWKANPAWLSIPEHMKLHYCYEDSPVCVPDGTPPFADGPDALRAVDPARHPRAACLARRRTLDARPVRRRLRAAAARRQPARRARALIEAATARGVPMRAVTLADPEVAALYETSLVLVRPDGHVAWRGNEMPGGCRRRSWTASAARPAARNRHRRTGPRASGRARARICYSGRNALETPHERNRTRRSRPARRQPALRGDPQGLEGREPRAAVGEPGSRTRSARAARRRTIGAGSRSARWSMTP